MRNTIVTGLLALLLGGCSAASLQETWDRQSTNQKVGIVSGLVAGPALIGPPGLLIGPIAGLGVGTAVDCVQAPDCP
jgi:ammonia channel protein AmtB